jgi:hypothetical protein
MFIVATAIHLEHPTAPRIYIYIYSRILAPGALNYDGRKREDPTLDDHYYLISNNLHLVGKVCIMQPGSNELIKKWKFLSELRSFAWRLV